MLQTALSKACPARCKACPARCNSWCTTTRSHYTTGFCNGTAAGAGPFCGVWHFENLMFQGKVEAATLRQPGMLTTNLASLGEADRPQTLSMLVQCERCQKWRRITHQYAATVADEVAW